MRLKGQVTGHERTFAEQAAFAAVDIVTSTEKNVSILILIASILLPPLGVALKHGISRDFWINLILTIILFVPGVIHAVYVNFLR